jgi:hypothetical protein
MSKTSSITDSNRESAKPTQPKVGAAKMMNSKLPRSAGRLGANRNSVKTAGMKKHNLPGGDKRLLGTHWRRQIDGMQKETVVDDAPSCFMTVRNLGPAMVEVRCPRKEPHILLHGKFAIMPVRGRVTVESLENESADICFHFEPTHRF